MLNCCVILTSCCTWNVLTVVGLGYALQWSTHDYVFFGEQFTFPRVFMFLDEGYMPWPMGVAATPLLRGEGWGSHSYYVAYDVVCNHSGDIPLYKFVVCIIMHSFCPYWWMDGGQVAQCNTYLHTGIGRGLA